MFTILHILLVEVDLEDQQVRYNWLRGHQLKLNLTTHHHTAAIAILRGSSVHAHILHL